MEKRLKTVNSRRKQRTKYQTFGPSWCKLSARTPKQPFNRLEVLIDAVTNHETRYY